MKNYDGLLLNSGGFDSVVLLHELCQQKKNILSVFFSYEQNNFSQEWESVLRCCSKLNMDVKKIELPFFDWSNSAIITGDANTDEYLPMRNLVFLSYAISIAESHIIPSVYFAALKGFYKDTQKDFIANINAAINDTGVKILTPYIDYRKLDVVKIARSFDLKSEDYFSCHYPQNGESCGVCSKCVPIKEGYEKAGEMTVDECWRDKRFKKDVFMRYPLIELRLLINNVCNLSCKHCFYDFYKMAGEELSFDQRMDVIKQAIDLGVINVHISGKEPLIDTEAFKYIDAINNCGISVDIVTNGVSLDNTEIVAGLKDSKLTRVCLSVDSIDDNNAVRSENLKLTNKLEVLRGINKPIHAFICLHKGNYRLIKLILSKCYVGGVSDFYISTAQPVGKFAEKFDKILSVDEMEYAYLQVKSFCQEYPNAWCTIVFYKFYVYNLFARKNELFDYIAHTKSKGDFARVENNLILTFEYFCSSFLPSVTLTPDGEILGCAKELHSGYKELSAGNVKDHSLKELLEIGREKAYEKWSTDDFDCLFCNQK